MKISSNASTILSLVLSAAFFVATVFAAIIMPIFINEEFFVMAIAYVILALVLLADALLFILLLKVRSQEVFSKKSVSLLRGISYCAIFAGIMFLLLTYYFRHAIITAGIAFFLGLCLRVVKNVIEKATEIKDENDLTV